jgi:hypothetical protein
MGAVRPFTPAKLVTGILISTTDAEPALLEELSAHFGTIDFRSTTLPFHYSHYYDNEMGTPIRRFFISFTDLVDPGRLSDIKITTNRIETTFMEEGKRKINIDPGLLFLSSFILATAKAYAHRIPLINGIYGEITLLFQKGTFRPVEWTYPDYRDRDYISILNSIRGMYMKQLVRLSNPDFSQEE